MQRIFVERKPGYEVEAERISNEVRDFIGITHLADMRFYYCYDIIGIEANEMDTVKYAIFAQKEVDTVSNTVVLDADTQHFGVASLESQYDQASDAATLLVKTMFPERDVHVRVAQYYVFTGITAEDLAQIQAYYINPVEKRLFNLTEGYTIPAFAHAAPVETVDGFCTEDIVSLHKRMEAYEVSVSIEDLAFIQQYFQTEGREPTVTELRILNTYWSDHCRHSTFLTTLDSVEIINTTGNKAVEELITATQADYLATHAAVYAGKDRPHNFMDMATLQMKHLKQTGVLTNLEETDEVNACSIEVTAKVDGVDEDFLIMFKNETHNHPTEIEPFGGASTCIGGAIRDPLSGRANVFGAMRVTGSADPREAFADTYTGKLPQRKITTTAAAGYSEYANQIGLASGYLHEYYHPGFKAKRMECGALVAYNFKKNIRREMAENGDVIIMLGGPTGRDGVGGATGSSREQTGASVDYSAEVQKGNPFVERGIIRLFKKPTVSKLIKKCNDFGAGGVSVAVGELADSLEIYLDRVQTKYDGLDGTELAISESQERMAVVVAASDVEAFMAAAKEEHVAAIIIADVTDSNRVRMTYAGQVICDVASTFLNSGGVRQHADAVVEIPTLPETTQTTTAFTETLTTKLASLADTSRAAIAEQFDKTVGGASAFYPFGGATRKTPEHGLAMRIPLDEGETDLGVVMTVGYNPDTATTSPFHGAYYAVLESVVRAVVMGAELADIRLTFQEYFESMKTNTSWGKVYAAMLGAFAVEQAFDIPSIGGKDSMSGSYQDLEVPPSLISFAVAPVMCDTLVSRSFTAAGNNVYLLETPKLADGTVDLAFLKNLLTQYSVLRKAGSITAASHVGNAGVLVAIAEMTFGNTIGCTLTDTNDLDLFAIAHGAIIIESELELPFRKIGVTQAKKMLAVQGEQVELATLLAAYEATLLPIFAQEVEPVKVAEIVAEQQFVLETVVGSEQKQPRIVLPIFYGTTSEYTVEKTFKEHGAVVDTVLINPNYTENYKTFISLLANADVLVLPAGATLGGQPARSGNYIALVLEQPEVAAAVNSLLARGGQVIGFGEGFQALLAVGLIEHGMVAPKTDSVVMMKNSSNHYFAGLVEVANLDVATIWQPIGKQLVSVASGDGAVIISDADFMKYRMRGQIISYYVSADGTVSGTQADNPFGAQYGIAAMASSNGQVFGTMADLSVNDVNLYVNIPRTADYNFFGKVVAQFTK